MNYFAVIGAFLTGVLICSYIDTKFLELQNVRFLPQKTSDRIKYDATDAFGRASFTFGSKARETTSRLHEALQNNSEIVANKFLLIFGQEPDIHKKVDDVKRKATEFKEVLGVKIKTVFTIIVEKLKSVFNYFSKVFGANSRSQRRGNFTQ